MIFAAAQIFGNNIVGIGGGDETRDGQAHALGEESGGEIAEISAGDGDDQRNRGYGKLAVSGYVVEHLRQEAADVDGVGGCEKDTLIEWFVREGLLHEPLTIVEGAGNFERGDVFTEGGELFFLGFADAFGRIKDHDANAGHAEKSMSDGATCVSGSGDQHSEGTRFATHEITHQAGHKARAKILEGQGGAVKKFEDVESRRK